MQNLKAGDLLISTCYANVWDKPGDVGISSVVDHIDEEQPVIVIDVYTRKYYKTVVTELKVLTPSGNIGWVAAERLKETWVIM